MSGRVGEKLWCVTVYGERVFRDSMVRSHIIQRSSSKRAAGALKVVSNNLIVCLIKYLAIDLRYHPSNFT